MTTEKSGSGVNQEGSTARTTFVEEGSTRRPLPMHRVHPKNDSGVIVIDGAFSHDDGWTSITVGWEEDAIREGVGAWVAKCSGQEGAWGISELSQMHALAELVRSMGALCDILLRRETELHRAIYNSPDALAKELREAESDLDSVQSYITTHVEPGADNWDAGLKPLWRAEHAVEAFAARIASAVDRELAVDRSRSTPKQ